MQVNIRWRFGTISTGRKVIKRKGKEKDKKVEDRLRRRHTKKKGNKWGEEDRKVGNKSSSPSDS